MTTEMNRTDSDWLLDGLDAITDAHHVSYKCATLIKVKSTSNTDRRQSPGPLSNSSGFHLDRQRVGFIKELVFSASPWSMHFNRQPEGFVQVAE